MTMDISLASCRPLLVCPSRRWGTIERRVIKDSLYLISKGAKPVILCRKDSYLDRELALKELDITVLYYNKLNRSFLFDFRYAFYLYRTMKRYQINFVHCYDLYTVWGASIALQTKIGIPLLLTFNHWGAKWLRSTYWHKVLLARVDAVTVFTESAKEAIFHTLPIDEDKISVTGLGASVPQVSISSPKRDKFVVAIFLSDHLYLGKQMRMILSVVGRFFQADGLEDFVFKIVTRKKMDEFSFFNSFRDEISLFQYEGVLDWVIVKNPLEEISQADIFWSLESSEMLSDLEVECLLSNTPVLLARSSSRQDLISSGPFLGESYKTEDAREVMFKLLKIRDSYSLYCESIAEQRTEISSLHRSESYQNHFNRLYTGLDTKRQGFLGWR